MSSSVSSFASNLILIVAAEGEVTSPSAATITMEIEAKLEALDDIRCQLFVGVNHHKRPGLKRSVWYSTSNNESQKQKRRECAVPGHFRVPLM